MITVVFILFNLFVGGERLSQPEYDILKGQILSVSTPDSVAFGDTVYVSVSFSGGTNGCAKADHLKVDSEDNLLMIEAYYNYPQKPEMCAMYVPTHKLIYKFVPTRKGIIKISSFNEEIFSVVKVY